MTFKQTITWHTADEKPDRKRYIIFIDKEDAYPTSITGYYLGNGDIQISNGLPGLNKLTWIASCAGRSCQISFISSTLNVGVKP